MNCQGLHPGTPADYYDGPNGGSYCRPCAAEKRARTARPRVRRGDPIPDRSWIDQAACADTDRPEAWFAHREDHNPHTGQKTPNPDYRHAKTICAGCPVAEACLADALAWESRPGNIRAGLYGGMDADERRELLKDRRAHKGEERDWVKCGTEGGYYRHRRREETPCDDCKAAHREYYRQWDKARREKETLVTDTARGGTA